MAEGTFHICNLDRLHVMKACSGAVIAVLCYGAKHVPCLTILATYTQSIVPHVHMLWSVTETLHVVYTVALLLKVKKSQIVMDNMNWREEK